MRTPCIVFVVGCPASGKTTLAQMICSRFEVFDFATDLDALTEIFLINDLAAGCIRCRRSPQEIEDMFSVIGASRFWTDILEPRIKQLETRTVKLEELETVETADGGHEIMSPTLWDEALLRSIDSLSPDKSYVFEFSRGIDQAYLAEFNIGPREVYYRSFHLIFRHAPNITPENSLVVHVSAAHGERDRRNNARKLVGKHFVSRQVMDQVYMCDVFCFFKESIPCTAPTLTSGFLCHEFPARVLSIDNTRQNHRRNFAPVIEFLKKEVL
jgi:hypothetical protein